MRRTLSAPCRWPGPRKTRACQWMWIATTAPRMRRTTYAARGGGGVSSGGTLQDAGPPSRVPSPPHINVAGDVGDAQEPIVGALDQGSRLRSRQQARVDGLPVDAVHQDRRIWRNLEGGGARQRLRKGLTHLWMSAGSTRGRAQTCGRDAPLHGRRSGSVAGVRGNGHGQFVGRRRPAGGCSLRP